MLIGISLLCVTGLDIVPILLASVLGRRLYPSVEWWNTEVSAWVHVVLWSPHYVAALIACMTGMLVLRYAGEADSRWRRVSGGVAAGLAFASAAGLGIYVAAVFAAIIAVWLTITLLKKRWAEAVVLCISGMVAFAAAAPYLMELRGGGAGGEGGGGLPIQFAIRPFFLAEAMVEAAWPHPGWRVPFVNALALPLNYFLELGFFFVAGVAQWKRMRGGKGLYQDEGLFGFVAAAISLLICSFFRSTVIVNNDLGYRGILIAQFMLLIWAADLWDDLFSPVFVKSRSGRLTPDKDRYNMLVALVVLGVAGSVYEATVFRFYPVFSDRLPIPRYSWLATDHKLGERTYALREVYDQLRSELPGRAVVQHNPNASLGDLFYGLYADRQAAAETPGCGVAFGGDPVVCASVVGLLNDVFGRPGAVEANQIDGICRKLSIDVLVVKDTDKIWADRNSWIWKKRPDLANNYARVFLCGEFGVRTATQSSGGRLIQSKP